jgi:hypothetical protein
MNRNTAQPNNIQVITTVQANNGSINLSLPSSAFYLILHSLSDTFGKYSDKPKELIKLYEAVVCLGVDELAVQLAGMIQKHLESNYNAFWEMYLASKPDGTETI